ncbi:Abi family protein [Limosilactobacillus fermentum]
METPESLSWEEQVALLKEQGMEIYDSDAETLKQISYYRIKEFAEPLAPKYNGTINYEGISFAKVIERYYQDKNLRIHLLHAIEQVETALKTKIAYILGKRYGAYGYLNFYKWANRSNYTDFYIEEKQYKFKKNLKETVKKSSLPDIRYRQNQNKDGFPTVWLAIDSLMFGGLTTIISIMGKRNLIPLANYFHCTGKELVGPRIKSVQVK